MPNIARKGDTTGTPVLVRMHALSIMEDEWRPDRQSAGWRLVKRHAPDSEAGAGVVVLIREPSATALSDYARKLRANSMARKPKMNCGTTVSGRRSCWILVCER